MLVLDEPTAGVDLPTRTTSPHARTWSQRGTTILLVAHELGPLQSLVDPRRGHARRCGSRTTDRRRQHLPWTSDPHPHGDRRSRARTVGGSDDVPVVRLHAACAAGCGDGRCWPRPVVGVSLVQRRLGAHRRRAGTCCTDRRRRRPADQSLTGAGPRSSLLSSRARRRRADPAARPDQLATSPSPSCSTAGSPAVSSSSARRRAARRATSMPTCSAPSPRRRLPTWSSFAVLDRLRARGHHRSGA